MTTQNETNGWVMIAGVTTGIPALYDPAQRWNGWLASPWLTREGVDQALTEIDKVNAPEHRLEWSWRDDLEWGVTTLRTVDHTYAESDPDDCSEVIYPRADGRYALGAYGWTWEEASGPNNSPIT